MFFNENERKALEVAIENFGDINFQNIVYAVPKSNNTIIKDLYRGLLRNLNDEKKFLSASSGGLELTVEKDDSFQYGLSVTINKSNLENFSSVFDKYHS